MKSPIAGAGASSKLSGGASSKKGRQLSFGEALTGWLKWSNSSKANAGGMSAKVAPAPLPIVQALLPEYARTSAAEIEARYM